MIKRLFFAPGRLLIGFFSGGKRKKLRSIRSRPSVGLGTVVLSLVCWLAVAGGVLFALDKAGLLKQALDAGVEVAGVNETEGAAPIDSAPAPVQEADTPNVTGSLKPEAEDGGASSPPPGANSQTPPETGNSGRPPASVQNSKPPEVAEMWVVMLHSIPKRARDEADRLQKQYRGKGLEVEILDSDAFPLLKSGHWIVALGPFDDKISATAAANRAAKFNTDLIIRRGL